MKSYSINDINEKIVVSDLLETGDSISDWEEKKLEIKQRLTQIMGGLPKAIETKYDILSEVSCKGYKRLHLKYSTLDDDLVTAYLMVPEMNIPVNGFPGVLALHQTCPEGKDESAGLCGNPDMAYGHELALRGYVVIVPDVFTAGERIPEGVNSYETNFFYEKYPQWSAMGKMLYDHIQGLNLLASLPYVDKDKIGAIGHSLGGHNAFFLSAYDERVKVTVSSCGLCSIAGDPNVFRWSRKEWFVYFNSLREYFEKGCTPFEFHEVLALVAPRPYFNWSTKQDDIFPHWEGVIALENGLKPIYKLYRQDSNVEFHLGEGVHEFPEYMRKKAYDFLDKFLK